MSDYYDKMRIKAIKKRMGKQTKVEVKKILGNVLDGIDELGIIFADEDVPELSAENLEKLYKYLFGRGYHDDFIEKGYFVEKIIPVKKGISLTPEDEELLK